MSLKNAWNHLKTITEHKWLVMQGCFKLGLYKQGILHDLSKYTPEEFWTGVLYYQGNRSPNAAEKEVVGYSRAWLHHKGRNKHHYEYWIDYSLKSIKGGMAPAPMPKKYVIEMLMDRIAASKVYQRNKYTDESPLAYYMLGKDSAPIHEETKALLEKLLNMLAQKGEKETFRYIREEVL